MDFFIPVFNKNREIYFTLKLLEEDAQDYTQSIELKNHDLLSNNYILNLKDNGENINDEHIQLTDNITLKYEIYVENTREAIKRLQEKTHPELFSNYHLLRDDRSQRSKNKVRSVIDGGTWKYTRIDPHKYSKNSGIQESERSTYTPY